MHLTTSVSSSCLQVRKKFCIFFVLVVLISSKKIYLFVIYTWRCRPGGGVGPGGGGRGLRRLRADQPKQYGIAIEPARRRLRSGSFRPTPLQLLSYDAAHHSPSESVTGTALTVLAVPRCWPSPCWPGQVRHESGRPGGASAGHGPPVRQAAAGPSGRGASVVRAPGRAP